MAKKKHDRWAEAQSSGLDALEKSGYRFSAPPQVEEAQVPAEPESRGVAGWAKDGGISLLKGAIALPESFVGMADIATGGRVGKALEGVGYEPSRARAILDEYLTDNQKAANAEFQKAEGIPGKFAAAIQNPSVIGQAVIESAPSMLGGAGVARGLLGVAPKMGAVAAGALGEGIVGAGQAAEQIRTQTPDRLLSADQSMSALASGAGTAVFGALGGKISQRLGIGDVDTMLAQAAINPVARKGVVRAAIEGFISEGVLEELPQSIQEQVWQNQALGRPLSDGVDEAAVLGLLSGGAMGMVAGPMSSGKAGDPIRDLKTGGTDPLSRAADIGLDAKAKQADVGITEGQYNAAMAAMEGQLSDDQKAIKNQGRADKTGFAGQPIPKAPSMAQAMGLMGDATQEVSAFADRAMLVKESLADPATRDFIRQNLGDEAFNEAAYYAEQADRPGDIPDKTRENMLALAEAIISRARLTPITPPAGLGSNVGPAPDALGAPQAVPAIGLDTTPTGAFRVDAAGNAAPEVRADVISTRQAQAERDALGTQARKSSAVPADPAPAQPQAPKAIGYDTTPTGVVRVDSRGQARPETRADQINARQSAPKRDDTTGQQARKASAVWADPAPKKRETPALGYDTSPTGRMVAGPDGISVETNAERINRQQARSIQPGDITRPGGQPFKNLTAAKTEQRRSGGAVVEVTGGWVVRPQAETINGDTGQTAGRAAGSVGAGSPDAPAGTQGAGFGSDVRGRTDTGGSGRADGTGVPERNLGSPVAAQPGAARDARGQLKPPAFLRKTLPEMTEDELTQASEFYGADHPRASKVKQEVEKRERKAKFEAKKNPKPEQANEQDAPQTQSAPTQAQPGQKGSDPAGTGTPGDGAKERVPGTGGADVQADGVTGQVVDKRPKARKHPPTVRGSGALADISRALGGLSPDLLTDLSEKVQRTRTSKAGKKTQYTTWDNPAIPGIGPLFRMGGTADLSEVARVLEESGYLEAGAVENDPVGAKQRAEAIIKAELRGRQEAAMDEMSDPWDDFSFAPEDLDAAGYTGLSEETRAATEQLISEAEGLGIDTEAIRDDTARIVGDSASQEEYHAATQEAIRQAIAQVGRNAQQADASGAREGDQGGGSPAEQAGGTRSQGQRDGGSDQEGLSLTAPTRADIEAQQDRAEQANALDEKAQAKRESEVGDSTFMTGFTGDGRQDNTGDLFSQAAQPDAAPEPAESQPITEAEARKRLEWRDMGQRDNTKRLQLSFQDADGRPMTYGTLTKDTGAKAWTVEDSDGWRHTLLAAAKKKAEDLAIERLRRDGYVTQEQDQQAATGESNDRDTFTLERLSRETNKMESVTFKRGEYIRHRIGEKDHFGEIDGISQARREFSVGGLWHPMGFANKAERPAAPVKKTEPLSKTIEKMNAKNGEGLTEADRVPEKKAASKTPTVDRHMEVMEAARNGKGSIADYKASFAALEGGEAAVKAELATKTKDDLLRAGGAHFHMRYKSETKPDIIKAFYNDLLSEYALGKTYGSNSWIMSSGGMAAHYKRQHEALKALVEAQTQEDLDNFAKEVADRRAEYKAEREAKQAAMDNPQTLSDFRSLLNVKIREGMTRAEAFLTLTPEQRIKYDELEADGTKESREAAKRAAKTAVRSAGQTTAGEIVATKHTRDGHDLWVVKLADRLSADDYRTVLASAKRLGGSYSSFRGNGAIPGFQFRTPEAAQAFLKLAGGDTTEAQGLAEQRRDAFDDDRSQSAVERLNEMADKLDDRAQESIDRDRKTNTARRARFAASADREAQEAKALAQTMRNIAKAIEEGRAKFLDGVRTRTQVELLRNRVAAAKQDELRAKHPAYADQEKRRGEPATAETADFAEFPSFSAFRSDLASLARQMLEVDGTKKLGQQLMSVADDVTDAYIEFAKKPENLYKLSTFSIRQGDDVKTAIFPSKDTAERAIRRSGLADRAIVLSEKRGVNRIIMSPSEAMSRGVWTGDGDKRITLTREFGSEMVQAIGRRGSKTNRLTVPWQFQTAHDRLNALKRIGIETPSEYRSALREFIGLQERAIVNKVREMELSMAGRKNDGLDFFPTPAEVADQMVAAADISPDMAVLEPSAGMGHIADRIREAGAEPDVIELAEDRRELLQEKGYNLADFRDFLDMKPRQFFTYGDVFRAPDGTEGVMSGSGGMGSSRVILKPLMPDGSVDSRRGEWYDRDGLVGVRHRGTESGYDRIIMNPPFSNGRDIEHVMHAYDLLKPGGRIVAIMGESAFFNQSKKAEAFRQWLDDKGGTSEKLPAGSFMDPSLPVNTGVNARMVVIDKRGAGEQESGNFSRQPEDESFYRSQVDYEWAPPSVVNRVKQQVESLRTFWKNSPEVVVLASFSDAPVEMQKLNDKQVESGAVGEPEGFFYKGKAYLLAPHMKGPEDVRRVLFHETLGHLGLRGVFGDGLNQILDQLWATRRKDVQAKADAYGLDTSKQGNRRMAAEEVLAEMAQDRPEIGFVRRAVAIIKQWLRKNLPGFGKMKMSDDEIVANFLMPAQRFIERGQGAQGQQLVPAFSRVDEPGSGFNRDDNGGMTKAEPSGSKSVSTRGAQVAPEVRKLNLVMRDAGWEVEYIDIDLTGEMPKANIRVNRADGRYLIAKVDAQGRASFETFQRERSLRMDSSTKGRRPLSPMIDDIFLGRQKFEGARSMMRSMVTYLTDNAGTPVSLQDMRSAWAGVMSAPAKQDQAIEGPAAGASFSRSATIKVDGKDRPTMNSKGQPIHPTEEGARNFWRWFGDSKAVDAEGRPLVVYHGTAKSFTEFADRFDPEHKNTLGQNFGRADFWHYFTPDPQEAGLFADHADSKNQYLYSDPNSARANVAPVYVALNNPLVVKPSAEWAESQGGNGMSYMDMHRGDVRANYMDGAGYDGIIAEHFEGGMAVVATEYGNLVKSAIGNSGDFNPEDPNIGFSRSAAATDLNTKARNAFSDFVGSAGVQMDWLDKTLKTQYAKAERFPEFKRVFDKLQDYIEGVSSFANQAADKAPDILPKLDSFKDLMREGPESLLRHGLSQEDIKALSAPVFEGTLSWTRDANGELVETQDPASAGVVFTDAELRDKFGMSKKQIGHYRQFRATVDESLDQVVAADIIKLLGKKAPAGLKALANTADGRARLREALRQTFGNSDDADAKAMWDDQIAPKYDHVASMKAKGYAPLSRFGKFFVHVVDKQTGETAYFGMEETRIMSNQRARDMREDFGPGFDVTQGTMSQESYKLMSDVPVDAMEMFASAIGAEKSEVFQKYIALAKNNRSTLKRLLKRKGRKGFSLDAPRVLASFVTSNARASAAAVNMMDAKELAQGIQAGDVKDEAIKLIEAVSEPQESGAKVRGLMFINFIGGSIASAAVNMTQPVMMTLPYLSQFGGITKAGKRLVSAAGMAVSGKVSDPEISEALKRAESEGIVAPQEIHHLLKQATSSAHINPKVDAAIQKLAFVWSTPFALAESFNRKASFIAAYQTAKDEGIANPYAFAQKAVTETQGLYHCVDQETECLTVAGWKRHAELLPGERVYAVDADGRLVESTLTNVHRHAGPAKVLRFDGHHGFSMVLTPGHDALVQTYSARDKRWQRIRKVKAEDLKNHQVVRVPLGDATGRKAVLSDDEVVFLAWVAAEGHLFAHRGTSAKRGVALVQSQTHNSAYVTEIRDLLARLGYGFNETVGKPREIGGQMIRWRVGVAGQKLVAQHLADKQVTMALVEKMTTEQMALFLGAFCRADGHFRSEQDGGGPTITQKCGETTSVLQAMAVLSGSSSAMAKATGHDWHRLYLAKDSKRAYAKHLKVTPGVEPMVWCPETTHGTWIARRNGRTFVTGNSGNKPNAARGTLGATVMTFKQYSIHYLEWLARMAKSGPEGKKAALWALALLVMAAGSDGLPFSEDLNDVIDTVGQSFGYDTNTKRWRHQVAADAFGEEVAEVLSRGFSASAGFPVDVSMRMGMGNLLPATDMLKKSNTDTARSLAELAGPGGALFTQYSDAIKLMLSGEAGAAAMKMAPNALQNLGKAAKMLETGEYRDSKDRKVMDVDGVDAAMKALSFQPAQIARESAKMSENRQSEMLAKAVEGEITDAWARAMVDGDAQAQEDARQRLLDWNKKNPDMPIRVSRAQIATKAKKMRQSRAERYIKTVAPERRQAATKEVES